MCKIHRNIGPDPKTPYDNIFCMNLKHTSSIYRWWFPFVHENVIQSMNHETHVFNVHGFHIKYLRIFGTLYSFGIYVHVFCMVYMRCSNEKLNGNTHPKCDTMEIDVRGWMNRGGVDLRSFSIKSKSVAKELSSWKTKTKINEYFVWQKGFLCDERSYWILELPIENETNVYRKRQFNLFILYGKYCTHRSHITPFWSYFHS